VGLIGSIRQNVFPLFYEVTRVSRYVVLADSVGGVTAPSNAPGVIGSEWAPRFDAPGIVSKEHAVIFFGAKADNQGARFSVRLTRSSEHLMMYTFTDSNLHSWHQIIRPDVLTPLDNELIFAAYEGATVTFSDVVILYTSDELTIKKEPVLTNR
jgi:hypothetical protein